MEGRREGAPEKRKGRQKRGRAVVRSEDRERGGCK